MTAPRGKRVRVVLKSGEKFVDKFIERKGAYVIFEKRGRVPSGTIRAFSILQQRKHP